MLLLHVRPLISLHKCSAVRGSSSFCGALPIPALLQEILTNTIVAIDIIAFRHQADPVLLVMVFRRSDTYRSGKRQNRPNPSCCLDD